MYRLLIHLAGKHRNTRTNIVLGQVLTFVAGAVNAGMFVFVAQLTSHVTGLVSYMAGGLATAQWELAVTMALYVGCFIAGAAASTMIFILCQRYALHAQYAGALILEAILLILVLILLDRPALFPMVTQEMVILLLCFLMGFQNALITRASNARIRTTHITGMITDIGSGLGRIMMVSDTAHCHHIIMMERQQLALHGSLVSLFVAGGVLATMAGLLIGPLSLLPMAVVLLLIALPPIARDIKSASRLRQRRKRYTALKG